MKLYLDTANDDFALAVFDNSYNLIAKKILLGYQKKVELIPQSVHEILNELNIKINDINSFYTNLGPGYFTGVRISLVYLRTIATCLKKPIYTISTMQILQKQNSNKADFFINAKGNKFYHYKASNDFSSSLITCETGEKDKYDEVNYELFLNNFELYLKYFSSYNNLDEIEPYYIKLPQIGAKK